MPEFHGLAAALVVGGALFTFPCRASTFDDGLRAWQAGQYDESTKLWLRAAKEGDSEAENALGNNYANGLGVDRPNPSEAFRWYKLSAGHGNADAAENLANCYEKGEGVSPNPAEAIRLHKLAAQYGNAVAQYNLGFSYEKGDTAGIQQSLPEAVSWYGKAAAQNIPQAEFQLAMIYLYEPAYSDKKLAGIELLNKSATHGFALAQQNLGAKYLDGSYSLIKKDIARGIELENLAAAQFNGQALSDLGLIYLNGTDGISADPVEAAKWFGLAAISYRQGKAIDKSMQVTQYYYSITQKLTETQISDVKRRAGEFIQINKIREK
jgi:TPR repeat protein